MIPGANVNANEYVWWYFDENTDQLRKVPDGLIPEFIEPEYVDENNLFN